MTDRTDLDWLVGRMVDRRAYVDDPAYKAQVAHLKHLLRAVEAAMQDEDVDATVTWRVLSRVATGGVPSPYEAYERMSGSLGERLRQAIGLPTLLAEDDYGPYGSAPADVNPGVVACPACHALIDEACHVPESQWGVSVTWWHVRRIKAAQEVNRRWDEVKSPNTG